MKEYSSEELVKLLRDIADGIENGKVDEQTQERLWVELTWDWSKEENQKMLQCMVKAYLFSTLLGYSK